jgi:hypothetical protein
MKVNYQTFLLEFQDCFAWNYKEMPELDPHVATHKLAIDPRFHPVKQQPRCFHPKLQNDIVAEVDKLIAAGFIKEGNILVAKHCSHYEKTWSAADLRRFL